MDPYVHNAKRIVVKSESNNISFVSSDSKIVTVTKDSKKPYAADVKAISAGDATISIFVDSTNNNKGMVYKIPVSVSTQGEDDIQVKDSAGIYGNEAENTIYLDAADQTASGAITSDKLTFVSASGLNVKDVKVADEGVVKFDKNTNTLSAAAKLADVKTAPKTTTVTVTTATDGAKNVVGGTKTFTVVVWGKVANPYKANDVTLSLSDQSKRTQLLTTDPVNVTVSWKDVTGTQQDELNDGGNDIFEMTNATTHDNTQTSATVIAKSFGSGRVKALSVETAQYRPTARFATVTVGADNVNVITVDKDSVVLTEGETAAINAKASETGKTVEVKSADSSVATAVTGAAVTAGTPITVTAVKAGQTTLTVSSNGATDKVIPVVVVSKNAIENATPEKVTGLKVSNKKGAHVSVKWTSQGKNINYRIWKKVGKGKWVGKNVAGNKTTLSVKKGAKVQVKVKAYVKDSNGKTTWGPKATKAKTFKSDKK